MRVARVLKLQTSANAGDIAKELGVARQNVQQYLAELVKLGLVRERSTTQKSPNGGRPCKLYQLSHAGERLFPKDYEALSSELMEIVLEQFGNDALVKVMEKIIHRRFEETFQGLEDLPLEKKLAGLRGLYTRDDPYFSYEIADEGVLVYEKNCPLLNIANAEPRLCTISIDYLSQMLGYDVIRTRKFQAGDGICAFKVLTDRPKKPGKQPGKKQSIKAERKRKL